MVEDIFKTFAAFRKYLAILPQPVPGAAQKFAERDSVLTKPPGALGRLEEIARWYVTWRGYPYPDIKAPQIVIFAGNHGVAARGVSAFPADVTAQMVENFKAGGAAINQIARIAGARLDVHPLLLDTPTADFTRAPAMTEQECLYALNKGYAAISADADLVVVGEMGIGNTTAGAAIGAALSGAVAADEWVGSGTGIDADGRARKVSAVNTALARQKDKAPLAILAGLGGREIAAMAGAIMGARARRIPVLIDGFTCTAAAAVLEKAAPGALDHCQAAHLSAEPAHRALLKMIGKAPILDLGLRLGEGSGAALAIYIVKSALACHFGMASFAQAGVSEK